MVHLIYLMIIAHHFHVYHIWSYSCYIVIQPYFHDILRNTNLLKNINAWANIEAYVSKHTFTNIREYLWFCFRNYLLMLTAIHFYTEDDCTATSTFSQRQNLSSYNWKLISASTISLNDFTYIYNQRLKDLNVRGS